MPKYVYCCSFDAPDDERANIMAGDADDTFGQFQEGSTPNGVTGVNVVGGGVVKVAN